MICPITGSPRFTSWPGIGKRGRSKAGEQLGHSFVGCIPHPLPQLVLHRLVHGARTAICVRRVDAPPADVAAPVRLLVVVRAAPRVGRECGHDGRVSPARFLGLLLAEIERNAPADERLRLAVMLALPRGEMVERAAGLTGGAAGAVAEDAETADLSGLVRLARP